LNVSPQREQGARKDRRPLLALRADIIRFLRGC
jgi:hypothetical protein